MKEKKPGNFVRELLGIHGFSKYGLAVDNGELLFCHITPINISVLSQTNISIKIHNIMMLSELKSLCTDSYNCYYNNKRYLKQRAMEETKKMSGRSSKKTLNFWTTGVKKDDRIRKKSNDRRRG